MNDLITQIRSLAVELSSRGIQPGHVETATQRRAGEINRQLVELFNTELETTDSGQRLPTAKGVILKAMIQHAVAAGFGARSHSHEEREQRILKAATELPKLAAQLQLINGFSGASPNNTKNDGTRQRRMSIDVANENLKQLLETDPEKYMEMGQVDLASAVGCSRGTLSKTSAYRIEIPKLRRKRR